MVRTSAGAGVGVDVSVVRRADCWRVLEVGFARLGWTRMAAASPVDDFVGE